MSVLSAPQLALAVLFLIGISGHASSGSGSFTYDQHFSPLGDVSAGAQLPIVISSEGPLVYGHELYATTDCSGERFHCIQSDVFSFAVPVADSMKVGDQWCSGENVYTVIREAKEIKVLGATFDGYLISSPIDKAWEAQFLYSKTLGLVAIATVSLDSGTYGFMAWLRDQCGLFAPDCPNNNE